MCLVLASKKLFQRLLGLCDLDSTGSPEQAGVVEVMRCSQPSLHSGYEPILGMCSVALGSTRQVLRAPSATSARKEPWLNYSLYRLFSMW